MNYVMKYVVGRVPDLCRTLLILQGLLLFADLSAATYQPPRVGEEDGEASARECGYNGSYGGLP